MRIASYRWVLPAIGWVLIVGCSGRPLLPEGERVVWEKDSLYHRILVTENAEHRAMRFGFGEVQGVMDLARPSRLVVPYTAYLTVGLAYTRPRRALMIGLAGGALVRFLEAREPGLELDVVEIDPDVVKAAERFFGVREGPRCRIHVTDGRTFVKRAPEVYDWVILDAFHADTVPHHLTTVEFLVEVKACLRPGGVVTANVAPLGPGVLYLAMIRTFAAAFPQVYLFQVPERGNVVVAATRSPVRIPGPRLRERMAALRVSAGEDLDRLQPILPFLEGNPIVADAPLLTDDYAPVDELRFSRGRIGNME